MSKKKVVKKTVTTVTEEIITGEKTQIVCILDRSGSMSTIIDDAIGGFNSFLKEQKKLTDDATITIALFDDRYDLLYNNVPIKEVELINNDTWMPRGTTALYDAIGKTINDVKNAHKDLPKNERPDKVLVCIVTDGFENSSVEYSLEMVKKIIKSSKKDGWDFIYLAANQDAFSVGSSFGVSCGNTFTFTADTNGVADLSGKLNQAVYYYRTTNTSTLDNDNIITNGTHDQSKDANDTITISTNTSCSDTHTDDKNNDT